MSKLPPVMGWSTWNQFQQHISEDIVMNVARSIKDTGLFAAGYRYINIDDCWQASGRDKNGRLCFDIGRFPSREGLIKNLNKLGFKAGLYSSCGALTCEDMPGSYGYEEIDAQTFADWGAEYLKYDYCHVVDLPTDPHFKGQHFANTSPPILYIGITPLEGSGSEIRIPASAAELIHPAILENDAITGLHCPRAAARLVISVPKSGLYQLAVGYKKQAAQHRKFVLVTTSDGSCTQVWFPPTSGWNSPARATVNLAMHEGENILLLTNPIQGQREDTQLRYSRMGEALKRNASQERPIYFSICEHGRTQPWIWAGDIGSSWRVSGDIRAEWRGVLNCYEAAADLWQYQQPGAYNDPDMLEVGIGSLSLDESQSHFVLWCMLSAPLILGLDTRDIADDILQLITNSVLISINQDKLLVQASRTTLQPGLDLLLKPLADGSCAL
ncbi:MAG: alpha-galactosidase, partial [Defluviitaleaceae bacterium]|nr:alpha-galactosidase [Defluviitaleaceae bacterium]